MLPFPLAGGVTPAGSMGAASGSTLSSGVSRSGEGGVRCGLLALGSSLIDAPSGPTGSDDGGVPARGKTNGSGDGPGASTAASLPRAAEILSSPSTGAPMPGDRPPGILGLAVMLTRLMSVTGPTAIGSVTIFLVHFSAHRFVVTNPALLSRVQNLSAMLFSLLYKNGVPHPRLGTLWITRRRVTHFGARAVTCPADAQKGGERRSAHPQCRGPLS